MSFPEGIERRRRGEMYESFKIGDRVRLMDTIEKIEEYPEKYGIGSVVKLHSHHIVEVQWGGVPRPILMRQDEITLA